MALIITGGIFGLNTFIHNIYISELVFCINFFLLLYSNIFFIQLFSTYKRSLLQYQLLYTGLLMSACIIISGLSVLIFKLLSPSAVTKIIFCISAFISFFVLLDIIKKLTDFYGNKNIINKTNCSFTNIPEDLPDIYHIITDANTGFDRVEYCDNYFKDELLKRGFHICTKAKSNYNYTFCSVPSVLNMDYIENITGSALPSEALKYYGENKVFNYLKNAGYKINTVTFNLYKHLLNNKHKFKPVLLKALSFNSIVYILQCFLGCTYVSNNFKELSGTLSKFVNDKSPQPKYFFGHLMAPHYPYLYNEDGSKIPPQHSRNLQYYFTYLKYTNKKLLNTIDELKKNMRPNSIILIHGDHSVSAEKEEDKFKILLAIYGNNKYTKSLPDNCSLVNLFRILFNNILNTNFPLLENKHIIVDNYGQIWNKNHFSKKYAKLKQKYKNKRIIFYGTGIFFKELKNNYNLSDFNIVGFSDIKYNNFKEPVYNKELGGNVIAPDCIYKLQPDAVFISLLEAHYAEKYFNEVLFKNKRNCFQYEILINPSPQIIIERLLAQIL